MSTASDDAAILQAVTDGVLEKKSANIILRPKAGVVGMLRMIKNSAVYGGKTVVIFRYGSGGFYDEQWCEVQMINGVRTAVYLTHMNLDNLDPFARLGVRVANQYNLTLSAFSKWTIAKSEELFIDGITTVWDELEIKYERVLTDVGLSVIATDRKGGWIKLLDNPNGDSASDIADWVDGSRSMGSTLYCADGSKYEELPGGTAPDKLNTNLIGNNFFNPYQILCAFTSTIEQVNPDLSESLAQVRQACQDYIEHTPVEQRSTFDMIEHVGKVATRLGLN